MKRFYYFIECPEIRLTRRNDVYVVSAGDSVRDQKALGEVQRICQLSNDFFFSIRNAETNEFIGNVSRTYHPQFIHISIHDLRRMLRNENALPQNVINLSVCLQARFA